jgi:hypothetical protein
MRNPVTLLALAAMLTPAVAQAAEDFRFGGDTGHRRFVTQSGIGAQASVAIKLDNMRVVRDRDRVRISLSAGPALSTQERSVTTGRALGINIKMQTKRLKIKAKRGHQRSAGSALGLAPSWLCSALRLWSS